MPPCASRLRVVRFPALALTLAACLGPSTYRCGVAAGEHAAYDPELPYQARRGDAVAYDVDFSAVVTAPEGTKLLRVWLPLPSSDAAQEVVEGALSTFPMQVEPQIGTESVFGNRFACFEFVEPRGAQIVRHVFRAKVWELHWDLDQAEVETVGDWPEAFAPYLRAEDQAVEIDEELARVWESIPRAGGSPMADMTGLMAWVTENFTYDHGLASLSASSLAALSHQGGHCSDYHGFCAAMGCVIGYPTRVAYGLHLFAKNSPSHCKLEVYLPPLGWVSFDVSETQRLIEKIRGDAELPQDRREALAEAAMTRLVRGFRDNTWLLQTKGTDYDLAPPASRKVPVVRTIYAEADGMPLPEPDPADHDRREHAWMTVHRYVPDRPVSYPFRDVKSLEGVDLAQSADSENEKDSKNEHDRRSEP